MPFLEILFELYFFLQRTYPGKIIIKILLQSMSCPDGLDKQIEEKILQKLSSLSLIPSNYKHILDLKIKMSSTSWEWWNL